ncbi:hypothetical protein N0B51_09605 [Tsuneonella sp. YG55]|uniref:Uncharacterized protein n=1 Tax=Tsuneonella litorea TaxID=2976475 RepID=A0A9X2W2X0_9SPHN|nr:hypothetical protein [Tsuneonella litorea]MCT2559239.1 hypothetical protein [Tsuneonella litorea]
MNLKAAEAETVAKLEALPLQPGIMLEPQGEGWKAVSPHNDHDLWVAQMAAAFGTRSIALVHTFADQLKELCPRDYDFDLGRWKTDEREWNALLALVADHQPETSTQAALAAQMASVHLMQIRLAKDALNSGGMVMEKSAALASKLARTFASQCETMMLLKGKKLPSRQTIRVEKTLRQEVHYHDHRTGGVEETDGQCDAKPIDGGELKNETAGRIADLREVPGDNKGGEVVPLARRNG